MDSSSDDLGRDTLDLRQRSLIIAGQRPDESLELGWREAQWEDSCCDVMSKMFREARVEDGGIY